MSYKAAAHNARRAVQTMALRLPNWQTQRHPWLARQMLTRYRQLVAQYRAG